MGALQVTQWDFYYVVVFDLTQYLNFISDFFFLHTFNSNLVVYTLITNTLISNSSFVFSLKLILTIMFLILIRGGTPRYRYDYLTKLGWLKFFGITVFFFLTLLFIYCLL